MTEKTHVSKPVPRDRDPIQNLIEAFRKLPGIGPKSAQRLVFYLLKQPDEVSLKLASAITELKKNLRLCSRCNNITDIYCTVSSLRSTESVPISSKSGTF